MKVNRISPVTGKVNSRELDITVEQLRRWEAGELIQKVMPNLSPSEREFLVSGCTDEDWETLFKPEPQSKSLSIQGKE